MVLMSVPKSDIHTIIQFHKLENVPRHKIHCRLCAVYKNLNIVMKSTVNCCVKSKKIDYQHREPQARHTRHSQAQTSGVEPSYACCTLLQSAFDEILKQELHETRLCECDCLHSCRELLILVCDTNGQPGETRDSLNRTSQPAKKVRANKARHKHWRLHKSIQGECFHLHLHSPVVSGSLGESVQPTLMVLKLGPRTMIR